MGDLSDLIYFQYADLLLFLTGFLFLVIGSLIYIFSEQRKKCTKSDQLIFFAFLLWVFGLGIWSDLLLWVFPHAPILEKVHYFFYTIAYIIWFEFGRRMMFSNNRKIMILLYALSIPLIFLDLSMLLFRNYFAFTGSLLTALTFYKLFSDQKQENAVGSYKIVFLSFPFFLLALIYFFFIIYSTFINRIYVVDDIHWYKHALEWSLTLIAAGMILHRILNISIEDPVEIQLTKIKLHRVSHYFIILLILSFIWFGALHTLGKIRWEDHQETLFTIVNIGALNINGNEHEQLLGFHEEEKGFIYQKIKNRIRSIRDYAPHVTYIYTMFIKDGQMVFGVDADTGPEDVGDHCGDLYYEATPKMFDLFSTEQAVVEDSIDHDRWGYWLSAYAPIKNDRNETVALLGMDISADHILNHIKLVRFQAIIGLLLLFIFNLGYSYLAFLRQKEKLWRNYHTKILSSIGDMVVVMDRNMKVLYANQAFSTLTGFVIPTDASFKMDRVFHNEEKRNFEKIMKNLNQEGLSYRESVLITIEEKQIPVIMTMTYLAYDEKDPLYVITAMDNSEQQEREKEIRRHFENTLSLLATVVDAKDEYTARHSSSVASYAKAIAQELGYDEDKIREIEIAALVHDIGKIAIPDHILKKKEPLTEEEWEIMKRHPEYGKMILEKAGATFQHLIPYIYHHHERYDGMGYPANWEKPPIPICIISVADSFDAMTSDRIYRKGLTLEQAKEELIKYSGTQFHPVVVQAMLKILKQEEDLKEEEIV